MIAIPSFGTSLFLKPVGCLGIDPRIWLVEELKFLDPGGRPRRFGEAGVLDWEELLSLDLFFAPGGRPAGLFPEFWLTWPLSEA